MELAGRFLLWVLVIWAGLTLLQALLGLIIGIVVIRGVVKVDAEVTRRLNLPQVVDVTTV